MQRVQNSLARTVCNVNSRCHIMPHLATLHWLPVRARIDYNVSLTAFKSLTSNKPGYLRDLLTFSVPTRSLRSSSDNRLLVPLTKSAASDRAFSAYAPKIWNSLPSELRSLVHHGCSIPTFKSKLKSHLFSLSFSLPLDTPSQSLLSGLTSQAVS